MFPAGLPRQDIVNNTAMSSTEADALRLLEEKTAYLERHIEAQDRELLRLWNTIDKLNQDLKKLQARIEEGNNSEAPPNDRPPHY